LEADVQSSGWNPCFTVEAIVRDVMVNMTSASESIQLVSYREILRYCKAAKERVRGCELM
jgi:hypothetical protein